MKSYSKHDHISLALWAAEVAESVLLVFEARYPEDSRPREAIGVLRTWAATGVFRMVDIRGASLAAHAAARMAMGDDAVVFAARAAGQAVATAHVPQHAFGAIYYALKAFIALNPTVDESALLRELHAWTAPLPEHLRQEVESRVIC